MWRSTSGGGCPGWALMGGSIPPSATIPFDEVMATGRKERRALAGGVTWGLQ